MLTQTSAGISRCGRVSGLAHRGGLAEAGEGHIALLLQAPDALSRLTAGQHLLHGLTAPQLHEQCAFVTLLPIMWGLDK